MKSCCGTFNGTFRVTPAIIMDSDGRGKPVTLERG